MKPWLVVAVGLGLALVAGYVLLASGPIGSGESGPDPDAPYGEIRDASREQMRDLLRDAEEVRP